MSQFQLLLMSRTVFLLFLIKPMDNVTAEFCRRKRRSLKKLLHSPDSQLPDVCNAGQCPRDRKRIVTDQRSSRNGDRACPIRPRGAWSTTDLARSCFACSNQVRRCFMLFL